MVSRRHWLNSDQSIGWWEDVSLYGVLSMLVLFVRNMKESHPLPPVIGKQATGNWKVTSPTRLNLPYQTVTSSTSHASPTRHLPYQSIVWLNLVRFKLPELICWTFLCMSYWYNRDHKGMAVFIHMLFYPGRTSWPSWKSDCHHVLKKFRKICG